MRSLYFKIFLWFWLAQMLLGLVVGIVAMATRPDWRDAHRDPNEANILALQARGAAAIYERDGSAALGSYLSQARDASYQRGPHDRQELYLFGTSGTELANRNAPAEARQLAKMTAHCGMAETISSNDAVWNSTGIVTPHGAHYTLVAVEQHGPMPGSPGGSIPPGGPRGPLSEIATLFGISQGPPDLPRNYAAFIALASTMGLVCYGLARYLTAPAIELSRATRRLAGGDLAVRVGPQMGRRRDELADLGRDFDAMAERIESLMLSERRLLGDISHELRSPLARMMVALDLADQTADPETAAFLRRIRLESERLNTLIGQLLVLTRLESGNATAEHAPVDLGELMYAVAMDADFEARARKCRVHIASREPCWTHGSKELLHSAIENVVRNAIRYTAPGTSVKLALECRPNPAVADTMLAHITVRDHGPGVPPEDTSGIFRAFYRVADARDRRSGGTGLGLAIADRAVRVHGGTIAARNIPHGGLLVEIVLPAIAAPFPAFAGM